SSCTICHSLLPSHVSHTFTLHAALPICIKGRSNQSSPAVELNTTTPKPALLLSLNKHMQTIARDGTLDINNRISDAGNKVTNRRSEEQTSELQSRFDLI